MIYFFLNKYLSIVTAASLTLRDGDEYDPQRNPGMRNAFVTAAMRFGHSTLQGRFSQGGGSGAKSGGVRLRDGFFDMGSYHREGGRGCDGLAAALMEQPARPVDRRITPELTEFLFANVNGVGGDAFSPIFDKDFNLGRTDRPRPHRQEHPAGQGPRAAQL